METNNRHVHKMQTAAARLYDLPMKLPLVVDSLVNKLEDGLVTTNDDWTAILVGCARARAVIERLEQAVLAARASSWDFPQVTPEHCVICGQPVAYVSMGNGEQWGQTECDCCNQVVCERPACSHLDATGYRCCVQCEREC